MGEEKQVWRELVVGEISHLVITAQTSSGAGKQIIKTVNLLDFPQRDYTKTKKMRAMVGESI